LPGLCILVSDTSLVAARDVARWREKIGPNTAERVTLHIVNKAGASGGLPIKEFVRVVGHAPDLIIPYNREIGDAAARGVKGFGQSAVLAQALGPMLQQITGEPAEVHHSLLTRLFG
jgi:pilus assembly protein CpaE